METKTDWLTGLMGRTSFLEHVETAMQAAVPFSVLLIDLDRLAHLNHDHTHHAGDEVLRSLARFLEQNVRDTDSVFRYGGNEFTILLPETLMSEAKAIAQQKHTSLTEITWSSHTITVSIGVASWTPEQNSWRDLIDDAEVAIREAKMAGGNCVRPV